MSGVRKTRSTTKYPARRRLYQLKVTLMGSKPPIWRRLIVRGDTTLALLHQILQVAMGWYDCHLHIFVISGITYADPDPDWDPPVADESEPILAELRLRPGSIFFYKYDMGDGWNHEILVEAESLAETARPRRAVCLNGRRACPPEDVGGVYGYEQFLEVLSDPEHEEYEETLEWAGGGWDPKLFSVAETDKALKEL